MERKQNCMLYRKIANLFFVLTVVCIACSYINTVYADETNIAIWLNCNYDVYSDDADAIKKDRPLVYFKGIEEHYRLLTSDYRNVNIDYNNSPYFDWCWFKNASDIGQSCYDENYEKYTKSEIRQLLNSGICPSIIRYSDDMRKSFALVFAGDMQSEQTYMLEQQYRFYLYSGKVYAYGFKSDGSFLQYIDGMPVFEKTYNVLGEIYYLSEYGYPQTVASDLGFGIYPQFIKAYGENFMKVAENFPPDSDFTDDNIIFDSKSNFNVIANLIDNWWFPNYGSNAKDKYDALEKVNSDYGELINSCTLLNEKMADNNTADIKQSVFFNYSADKMVNDLKTVSQYLETIYNDDTFKYKWCSDPSKEAEDASRSAADCVLNKLLGDVAYTGDLYGTILSDIQEYMENNEMYSKENSTGNEPLNTLWKCSSYLDIHSDEFGISDSDIESVRDKYDALAEKRNLSFAFDCESLLGDELIEKLTDYINLIKIAIPIILIGFGVFDFSKGLFSKNDDEMKKAKDLFIKRLFIAVLIFLTPTIVELILTVVNKVWSVISPNSCGLF